MKSFGRLISYGGLPGTGEDQLIFSGDGAISPVVTGWPTGFSPKYVSGLQSTGYAFPIDTLGYSPAPLDGPPVISYSYILVADAGLTEGLAFRSLRTTWQKIWDYAQTTHTLDGVTGVTGQRGWLCVADEEDLGLNYFKCRVRFLEPAPFTLEAARPHELTMTLTFACLDEFEEVTLFP